MLGRDIVQSHRRCILARHDPFRQFSLEPFPISAEKPGVELRHLGKQHIAGLLPCFVGNVQYFRWLLIWMRRFGVLLAPVLALLAKMADVFSSKELQVDVEKTLHELGSVALAASDGQTPNDTRSTTDDEVKEDE